MLEEESDDGCVEYKLRLSRGNPTRFQQLVTQLKYRISEGGGQCFYCLGVEDNGHPVGLETSVLAESIAILKYMAAEVENATATVIRTPPGTEGRLCAFVCVRRGVAGSASDLAEVRIAVAGAVDGGKSTLISVLCHGADGKPTLDNGRGAARMAILRHKHEIESGRTSSVSHRILAYSPTGAVLNYSRVAQFTPRELAAAARKFVRFSDLGGHQRYSKTSLHGLTSTRPDYTMLCICASQGISWVTLDHLAVSLALGVPVFVVVTKVDAVDRDTVEKILGEICMIAGNACVNGGVEVENVDQAIHIATEISGTFSSSSSNINETINNTQAVVPVFCVSCVSGTKIPELHAFFNALTTTATPTNNDKPTTTNTNITTNTNTHFQVDGSMDIAGVGPVFSGVVISGSLSIGDELLIGPDDNGKFRTVVVSGLHRAQVDVDRVYENQHATVAVTTSVALGAVTAVRNGMSKSSSIVREYEGEDADKGGITSSSSGSDLGAAAAGVVVVGDETREPFVVATAEEAAAAAAEAREVVECLVPPREIVYKKQTSQTTQADIELLGKSWDFVRHLTKPDAPTTPTAVAAGFTATATAAAASKSSSSADLSPSDDVDHVSAVPPLRPRKGTVLLGCCSTNRSNGKIDLEKEACRSFAAMVALLDHTEKAESVSPTTTPTTTSLSSSEERTSIAALQVMVHCGGVRQAADVIAIDYFTENEDGKYSRDQLADTCVVEKEWNKTLSGARAAAAVLQHRGVRKKENDLLPPTLNEVKTAYIKFKFSHRPEWLLLGSRVIFRDKISGKVVGAGVVCI